MSEQTIGEFPFMEEALKAPLEVLELITRRRDAGSHALPDKLAKQLSTPRGRKAYMDAFKPVLRYAGHKIKQLRGTASFAHTKHDDRGVSTVLLPSTRLYATGDTLDSVALIDVPCVFRTPHGAVFMATHSSHSDLEIKPGTAPKVYTKDLEDEGFLTPGWAPRMSNSLRALGRDPRHPDPDPYSMEAAIIYVTANNHGSISQWLGRSQNAWSLHGPGSFRRNAVNLGELVVTKKDYGHAGFANILFDASFAKYRHEYLKWSILDAEQLRLAVYPVPGMPHVALADHVNKTRAMAGHLLGSYMMATTPKFHPQSFVKQTHQLLDKDLLSFMSRYLEPTKQMISVYNVLIQLPQFMALLRDKKLTEHHGKALGIALSIMQGTDNMFSPDARDRDAWGNHRGHNRVAERIQELKDIYVEVAQEAGGVDALFSDQAQTTLLAMKALNHVFIGNTGEGMPSAFWRFLLKQGTHTISVMFPPRNLYYQDTQAYFRFLKLVARVLPKAKVGPTFLKLMLDRYKSVHQRAEEDDLERFDRLFGGFMLAAHREVRKKGSMKRAWIRQQEIDEMTRRHQMFFDQANDWQRRRMKLRIRVDTATTPSHSEVTDWLKTLPNLAGKQLALPYEWWTRQARAWHESPENPRFLDNLVSQAQSRFRELTYQELNPLDDRINKLKQEVSIYETAIEEFHHGQVIARALTSDAALKREGDEMHHCVGGYGRELWHGETRIFAFENTETGERATLEMRLRTNRSMRWGLAKPEDQQRLTFWEDGQFYGRHNQVVMDPTLIEARDALLKAYSDKQQVPHDKPNMAVIKPLLLEKLAILDRGLKETLAHYEGKLRPAQLDRVKKQLDNMVRHEMGHEYQDMLQREGLAPLRGPVVRVPYIDEVREDAALAW